MIRWRQRQRQRPLLEGFTSGSIAVPPPVGPSISTVSQTAGTINGGTVITVTGNGFAPGMTSQLGAVTYVSAGQCTITTNAGSAGAFSWTVTVGGVSSSPAQTYTYLPHPVFTSITPNNGPQTLVTPGVVVAATGLPASGTGCPVVCTVGGSPVTSIVLGSGSFTCTVPTGSSSGATNVVLTVDGVNATGGPDAWTYNPPPQELGATNVGTQGGTSNVTGQYFVNGLTASVNINGTPTALTVTFISSTRFTGTLPAGTYTPSTGTGWPLTVTNPDGQSVTSSIFVITTDMTPLTIFGATLLRALFQADSASVTGTTVNSVPDGTGNGNTETSVVSPVYNASDTNFSGHASITHAVGQYLSCATPSLGTPTGIYAYMIGTFPTSQSFGTAVYAQDVYVISLSTNVVRIFGGTNLSDTTNIVGTPSQVIAGWTGTGLSVSATIKIDNDPGTSGTLTSFGQANTALVIGASPSGGNGGVFTWTEIGLLNGPATSTQWAELSTYAMLKYGVPAEPSFSMMTNVPALTANGFARVTGSGFLPGTTVTIAGTMLTPSSVSATTIELNTIPSLALGQYDLQIDLPTGGSITINNAVNVVPVTTDPMTICQALCCAWFEQPLSPPASGSPLPQWDDLSGLASTNTLLQPTTADQPTYTASDPNYNNHPSVGCNGTSDVMQTAGNLNLDGGAGCYTFGVYRATGLYGPLFKSGALYLDWAGGTPVMHDQGYANAVTWSASISGTKFIECSVEASKNMILNVSNGTAVNGTSSGTPGSGLLRFGQGASYYNGGCSLLVVCNGNLSSTQRAQLYAYAQSRGAT